MVASLRHRGPDARGVRDLGAACFGHARLKILDLTERGNQPMHDTRRDAWLSYNGEVYNFVELRQELEAGGETFLSHSDSEVVLKALGRWGSAALPRFNGMFALAYWDNRAGKLLLARDPFGIKPLHFANTGDRIAFASEIKALRASGDAGKRIDPQGLAEYLYYGNALGTRSLYAAVTQLVPGSFLEFDGRGPRVERYWRPEELEHDAGGVAADRVRDLLEQAVKRHMVSDVPIGVFLSGGLDSSTIAAFGSRHSPTPLKTYSVGFDFDGGVNELADARAFAEHLGTEHHELTVAGYALDETIRALVQAHDQPFGDSANIPLFLLCQQLRGDPKVVLQGDGGDEIFAGYRRYRTLAHPGLWRRAKTVADGLSRARLPSRPNRFVERARRYVHAAGATDPATRMARLLTVETPERSPLRVLGQPWRRAVEDSDPMLRYRQAALRYAGSDPVQMMLLTDAEVILPDIFLPKVDRSTMAHSIEVRVPLLDHALCRYVMALPAQEKLFGRGNKSLMRRALRGVLPQFVLNRAKKGFGVPVSHWMRTSLAPLLEETIGQARLREVDLFDTDNLRQAMEAHRRGSEDNGVLLYKVLNLGLWVESSGMEPV